MIGTSNPPMLCPLTDQLAANLASSGGKSAGLHKLFAAGLPVPPGFVVTTSAFQSIIIQNAEFRRAVAHLNDCAEGAALREGAEAVRKAVLACELPEAFARDVVQAWKTITESASVAVRSSATAEDLAGASFAGQQDTFLEIDNEDALLRALRGCWASLFTERAVVYRRNHGFDNARVSMAVVVQRMVHAEAAGVLFTADPISGQRGISVIEAVAGLGEALVSGHVTPERHRVRTRDGAVLERKDMHGAPLAEGNGILSSAVVEELRALGEKAQNRAGEPLDIEWATEGNRVWLLQARPITTLWPLPEGDPLPGWRVFISFGHVQVYTSPLSRVAMSTFRRLMPLGRDETTGLSQLVRTAGERIYIDATPVLARQPFRTVLPKVITMASEPIAARLEAATKREELNHVPHSERVSIPKLAPAMLRMVSKAARAMRNNPENERDAYLTELESGSKRQQERLNAANTLGDKLDIIFDELGNEFGWMFSNMFPRMFPAMAMSKVIPRLAEWIDPSIDHRALLQGLEGNITTEMDMALADLSDLARDVPALVAALRSPDPTTSFDALRHDAECAAFFRAWDAFLARYGHRSAGEIDPGVPRWREDPRIPLRSVAGALDRPKGALREQHRTLRERAIQCRNDIVNAARDKPFGRWLAPVTGGLIDRMRTFQGVREQHKFMLVETVDRVRQLALESGALLERAGALSSADEIWLLELDEIRNAVRDVESGRNPALRTLIAERRALREQVAHLSPPAVLTSEGESLSFIDKREIPANSLAGTAVSGGIYEGTARVVHDPATEELGAGEVLVARFTDPGWTPLFGHAGALVMEVGGQMTHGSVIAREIGIPAVVAVEGATAKIKSGDRLRVDGERGWVTLLEGGAV